MASWLFLSGQPPTKQAAQKDSRHRNESPSVIARFWLRSEQYLAIAPTVALAGMYGAAAFVLLSLGPAWVGFLAVGIPILGAALWAFSGSA